MAKYKHYDYSQGKFIPINFDKQVLHGTFEHTPIISSTTSSIFRRRC